MIGVKLLCTLALLVVWVRVLIYGEREIALEVPAQSGPVCADLQHRLGFMWMPPAGWYIGNVMPQDVSDRVCRAVALG
jgi:hypothetical protein